MQSAPASNTSYALKVKAPPKMCTIVIQTDLLPALSTSTVSPSTSASSPAKSTSTSTKTSTAITSSAPYLSAISRVPSKSEKTDKADTLNLTKLERTRPSHIVAARGLSRRSSHARSLSTTSGELTVDNPMDFTTSKGRERPPSSSSERKRTKKHGCHLHSYAIMFKVLQWNCRSIRNSYLSLLANIHRPSVICLRDETAGSA